MTYVYYGNSLYHHGVKGMRWGVRRYQNPDGSLTEEGKRRQDYIDAKNAYKERRKEYTRSLGTYSGRNDSSYRDRMHKAEYDMIKAKAKRKGSAKYELATYSKQGMKYGLPGSMKDFESGGKSTYFFNELAKEKGNDYVDRVHKQALNRIMTQAAVGVGLAFASSLASVLIDAYD